MAGFADDVRYALRTLRESPGLAAIAVLSLALATGAATAVFGFLDALLFRPLHVPAPDALVTFEQVDAGGSRYYNLSLGDRDAFAIRLAGTADDAPFVGIGAVTWADGFDPAFPQAQSRVSLVSGNYFSVLRLDAARGRAITEDDERRLEAVAMISDRYWQRRYGRSPSAIGAALVLNGASYTIVGVAPGGFTGDWVGWPTDVWVPATMASRMLALPGNAELHRRLQYKLMARLRPGVPLAHAAAATQAAYEQLQAEPASRAMSGVVRGARVLVVPAATGYSPQRASFVEPLGVLMAVTAVVLLIACSNTANLLLARAAYRQREIAVRLALGASRARIVRLLLTESALLVAAAAAAGLIVARWSADALTAVVRSAPVVSVLSGIPTADLDVALDARVFVFLAVLSALIAGLTGLTPALRASKTAPAAAFARRGAGAAGAGANGPRGALLAAQIAGSLAILIAAGLMARTLHNLRSQDLGFDRREALLVWTLPGQAGKQGSAALALWRSAQERIAALPGATSVSASVEGLLTGASGGGPRLQADANPDATVRVQASMTVAPRFFETAGQRLLSGRDFTWDDTESAPPVAIVNATLARQLFGSEDAAGRRVTIAGSTPAPLRIAGVVADARTASPRAAASVIYYPAGQNLRRLSRGLCLVVRADGAAAALAPRLRAALRDLDPGLPVVRIDSVQEQLESVLFEERLLTGVSLFLAGLAVLLTGMGLYALVAFTALRRTSELGIRLALGATPASIARMVLRDSAALVLAGAVAGIPLTVISARWLAGRLFGVGAADPPTIAFATLLLLVVVSVAGGIPARRASRIDPIAALRAD